MDEKSVQGLDQNLQRIFGLKVGRTTFREAQNAILAAVQGDKNKATTLLETLLSGEVKEGTFEKTLLRSLLKQFTIPLRLARDVFERGDFLQVITSDTVNQSDRPLFVNRIKRVDGEEHQFICDISSSLHLLNHFVSRLHELAITEKKSKPLDSHRKELSAFKQRLDQLLSSVE